MSNEFAWALALAPLIILFVVVTLLLVSPQTLDDNGSQPLVVLVVWVALGRADVSRVRAAGYPLSNTMFALALLAGPLYLFFRSARTNTSYAIPMVGLISIVASFFGYAMVPSVIGSPLDGPWIERAIERWYFEDRAPAGTGAQCPNAIVVGNGDTFTCTLDTRRDSFLVDVTMQDATTGEVVWQLR